MAEYANALVTGDDDVAEVLHRLADHAVEVLGLAGAGVLLRSSDGPLESLTATDGRASRVGQAWAGLEDGPCFHAFRSARPIAVSDIESDDRWADQRESMTAVGYRAVASVPMPVGRTPIGVVNLYETEPCAWDGECLDVARLFGDMAGGYVLMARSLADSRTLSEQLQHALDSRVVVEQAKGMLSARLGIDVDEAFERMRAHARSHRKRVRDVADAVVAGRLDLLDEPAT